MPSRTTGVYDAVARDAQLDVEVEVLDELLGQQRDQVGVARQPGLEAGERLALTAAPPAWSSRSSTRTESPARAR